MVDFPSVFHAFQPVVSGAVNAEWEGNSFVHNLAVLWWAAEMAS